MCEWSENDRKYIVTELLRFALDQSDEFQQYKAERDSNPLRKTNEPKPISTIKPATDLTSKASSPNTGTTGRQHSTEL